MIGKLYIQDVRQVTVQKSDLEGILREYLGFPSSAHINRIPLRSPCPCGSDRRVEQCCAGKAGPPSVRGVIKEFDHFRFPEWAIAMAKDPDKEEGRIYRGIY